MSSLYKQRELQELRHESNRLSVDTGRNCDAIYRVQSDIDDIKIVRRLDERLARLEDDLAKAKER